MNALAPHPVGLPSRWRFALLLALLATIPAFYLDLLDPEQRWLAGAVYLLAAAVQAGALLALWRRPASGARPRWRHQAAGLLEVGALVVCALLPASSDSQAALAWRMGTAAFTLLRIMVLMRPSIEHGSLRHVLMLSLGVLGACGLGFWWLEPSTPTLADGLWLAFTTAATVGYGDVVPTTTASKIFAVFVVLLGYAALSLVTAAIAARWVRSTERQIEREILHELHREVRELRNELAQLRASLPPPPSEPRNGPAAPSPH